MSNLPNELLLYTFRYFENDYKTIYSCIFVNRQWHNNSIPLLWRKSISHKNSLKIIINCLLEEEKDFLVENEIELNFNLLKNPPLHNYAKFINEIDVWCYYNNVENLIGGSGDFGDQVDKLKCFKEKLLYFILDHSVINFIKNHQNSKLFIDHYRFDDNFQNLFRLECCSSNGAEFFNRLADVCKNIQILDINVEDSYEINVDRGLARLIKAQNEIKELAVISNIKVDFSDDFKEAISIHSQSITYYFSNGNHDLESFVISSFQNLKFLILRDYIDMGIMKHHTFPNLEYFHLLLTEQEYLSDLTEFIKNNGMNLKCLIISGNTTDDEDGYIELIQLIGECCHDLEHLVTFYRNGADQQLANLFNNCVKLEAISFKEFQFGYVLDGNRILGVLNQTLPENLKSMTIDYKITISDYSLQTLMKNWKGTVPFTLNIWKQGAIPSLTQRDELDALLIKYRDLGFLKIINHDDDDAIFDSESEEVPGQKSFFNKVTLTITWASRYFWNNFFGYSERW